MNKNIIELLERIEAKLDAVIKALHEYDDDSYGESSFETFMDTKTNVLNWDVDGAERRMDIIGQNGNEGLHYTSHYVSNEEADEDAFNDYGARVDKDKSNNTQPKQKQYYKNKHSKRNNNKK
jgi:hypothetical protein